MNCDSSMGCHVINILELDNDTDVYDYLSTIYMKYRKNRKQGKFDTLCNRLNMLIASVKEKKCRDVSSEDDSSSSSDDEYDYNKKAFKYKVKYEEVYDWIKGNCSADGFDQIIVEEHQLIR
jgi:predicted HAD superfamily hydrolase